MTMKRVILMCVSLGLSGLAISGCASTPQQRGPYHEYLHQHGLE